MIDQVSRLCPTSSTVDLRRVLTKLTNGIVSRVALGKKYGGEDGKEGIIDILREYGVLLGAFCMGDHFPSLSWVDVASGLDGRLKRASRTMDAFLESVINEHQERNVMEGQDGDDEEDFVDVLLHLQKNSELDRDSVKALILVSLPFEKNIYPQLFVVGTHSRTLSKKSQFGTVCKWKY